MRRSRFLVVLCGLVLSISTLLATGSGRRRDVAVQQSSSRKTCRKIQIRTDCRMDRSCDESFRSFQFEDRVHLFRPPDWF